MKTRSHENTDARPHGGDGPSLGASPWRVLVLPGVLEVGLEINRALRFRPEVELIGGAVEGAAIADVFYHRNAAIPHVYDVDLVAALNRVIDECAIDAVFPTTDDLALRLAGARAEVGAAVMTSPLATCRICRSKARTYSVLAAGKVAVPRIFEPSAVTEFPVYVKPDSGQGGLRARRIDSAPELSAAVGEEPDLIVTEFLPGPEYTIDCLTDRRDGLVHHIVRERLRARNGIAVHSRSVRDARFAALVKAIDRRMTFRGPWFFQVRVDMRGELKVLEVAPRVSASMAMSRALGVNFALLALREAAGMPIEASMSNVEVEAFRPLGTAFRYAGDYGNVYLTLTSLRCAAGVNTSVVRFVHQCINRGVAVRLVTHGDDRAAEFLRRHRLLPLFDAVLTIDGATASGKICREHDSILIANDPAERHVFADAFAGPIFAPSSIECLIDERA